MIALENQQIKSDWRNIRSLGKGTFSEVYLIKKQEDDEIIEKALKIIRLNHNSEGIEKLVQSGYSVLRRYCGNDLRTG